MKYIILLLIATFAISCKETKLSNDCPNCCEHPGYNVVVIDGCEYIESQTAYRYYVITHKGNCKNHVKKK